MIEQPTTLPASLPGRPQIASPAAPGAGAHTRNSLHAVMRQLSKSLTVLASTADLIVQGRVNGVASQSLLIWLQPNARQAEAALHRLREYRLAGSPAATELIQCLTVLVLAADMIVQGQLSGNASVETYDLLRRNADRAMKSLHELKAQLLPNVRGFDEL